MPKELCSVKYNDLEHAIRNCLFLRQEAELVGHDVIFMGKMDLSSAFRVLPLKVKCFKWLILKAVDPSDGKTKFFIEKCLPFGSSISCSHYQRFSNALKHILEYITGTKRSITNYLDDFLFLHYLKEMCDSLIGAFLELC